MFVLRIFIASNMYYYTIILLYYYINILLYYYITILLYYYITIFPDAVARVLLPYISAQGSEASLPRDLALSLWAGIGAFVQSARERDGA